MGVNLSSSNPRTTVTKRKKNRECYTCGFVVIETFQLPLSKVSICKPCSKTYFDPQERALSTKEELNIKLEDLELVDPYEWTEDKTPVIGSLG